jgi:dATP pyrophosphohydrolase
LSPAQPVEPPEGDGEDEGHGNTSAVVELDAEPEPTPEPEGRAAYKRPESVLVVVLTWPGEFLLLRRSEPTGFWQSVTGSLEAGEGARLAAVRELREETGLQVSPSRLVDLHRGERFPILPAWRARYAPGVRYNQEHWFALMLPGRRLIRLHPGDHLEYRWVPARQAAFLASSWTNRKAILALDQMRMSPGYLR